MNLCSTLLPRFLAGSGRHLWKQIAQVLQVGLISCRVTSSVRVLKETQSTVTLHYKKYPYIHKMSVDMDIFAV